MIRKLAVYCGSAPGTDPAFAQMARALVREMAARGRSLEDSLRMGAIAAAEVLSHVGARPAGDLRALVETL